MSGPRMPRNDPLRGPRLRPSDERAELARAGQANRRLAVAALVIAVVAVALAAWRFAVPAGGTSCQDAAWGVSPKTTDLPQGWTISGSQYDVLRKQMTLLGVAPSDQTTSQAVVYATITCFPAGAADAVDKSEQAAKDAGQQVSEDNSLGDQGFSAIDDSGASFIQFRHGDVVTYLAASGDATPDEVAQVASAFDLGQGGDGGAKPVGTEDVSQGSGDLGDVGASDEPAPSDSPAAPELEAALPTKVGDVTLTAESMVGSSFLGDDQGSRAIAAALREAGKTADDLKIGQAFDEAGNSDLSILAMSVNGMKADALKALVLDSWLAANGTGVKHDTVTLGGHQFTRIDYGDQGPIDYVLAGPTMVRVIETADASLAAQAAAALP